MRKFLFVFALLIFSVVIAHGNDRRQIWKAELVGVWSTPGSFVWLYQDRTMKVLKKNCRLVGIGTWEFEYGQLRLFASNGKEVLFRHILEAPTSPKFGDKIVLDTKREWVFMGRDTSTKC